MSKIDPSLSQNLRMEAPVEKRDCLVSCSNWVAAEDRETCNAVNRLILADGATDSLRKDAGSLTNYVVIDCISTEFDLAILGIKRSKVIGLAMEGIREGRLGELCWLQISLNSYTFLFDIVALGSEVFDEGLKDVIEDCNIVKVVHDCRSMSDYLYHRHNIQLVNMFDTQVADLILFRMRNVNLLPLQASDLTICVMRHLGLPATLFSTRYLKVLKDITEDWRTGFQETAETWRHRPASESVLEAAVFRVCYLPKLRLRLIELLLTRFTDGCDVYLGVMRDSGDNQVTRLETQTHLLPSEFEDLAFFAESSRLHLQELRQTEVVHQHSALRNIPLKEGSFSTFFNGGSKLYDLVEHGIGISPNELADEMNVSTDEDEDSLDDDDDDDSSNHNVDYDMPMQDSDAVHDLCQKDVIKEDKPVADSVSDLFLDVKYDSLSGCTRNDLNLTTKEVKCNLVMRHVTNDMTLNVADDLSLQDLKEYVCEVDGKMSQRCDSVASGDSCQKARNVVTSCNGNFNIVQSEETGLGSILKESHSEKPVGCLEKPVGYTGKLVGCSEELVGSSEKPFGFLEKPFGCKEKLVGSLEKPVWSEKPVGVSDLISKTDTHLQIDDPFSIPSGYEKFTGLRNLPHRDRFLSRGNSSGKPFVPHHGRFRRRRNFRNAMSEWVDARCSDDESVDSVDVSPERNCDDPGEDTPVGEYESYVTEHLDRVGDSRNTNGKDIGDTQNHNGTDLSDSQDPVDADSNYENSVDREGYGSQNPVGEGGEIENAVSGVRTNLGANQNEGFVLGNCGFSDRSAKTSLKQGLVVSRLPKKFTNHPTVKTLPQAARMLDGKNEEGVVVADGIKRVNLAACGRGKALEKAVELLQLKSS